ncbi:MAG: hypothetical protein ACFE9L_13160 [Candidatus Hodarchaeota archaeon]
MSQFKPFYEVEQGYDSLKRYLNMIVKLLPDCIKKYSPEDQVLLNDFLLVLQHYEEADYNRESLSNRFAEYSHKYNRSETYLHTPFLWFTVDYFEKANLILSLAEFHGTSFYKYLVEPFRRSSTTVNAFQLIHESSSLTDLEWERLQYNINKIQASLTDEQLRIIETVYSSISETGIHSMNPHRLRKYITKKMNISITSRYLNHFFSFLGAQWSIWFYPPAFGLKHLFINFQLDESTSLDEIIDFQNPANTTLCYNRIYRILRFHNSFSGYLIVPLSQKDQLRTYLQQCEHQGQLILHNLMEITDTYMSASLKLYKAGRGWHSLSRTKLEQLTLKLKTKQPKKRRIKLPFFFRTNSFNHYYKVLKQHHDPLPAITLYCKFSRNLSFKDLALDFNETQSTFNTSELSLLSDLIRNHVCQPTFFLTRLIYDFSLDFYLITLPLMQLKQLAHVLTWLPYGHFIFTETNIYIWAFLTPEIVQWMRTDLEWSVLAVSSHLYSKQLDLSWFNEDTNQWRAPLVLRSTS